MKPRPSKQLNLLSPSNKEHGGVLRAKRRGRTQRPLASRHTIHLVLRSTKATGSLSFTRNHNLISALLRAQAKKSHVRVVAWSNVGNHLHLHIQLPRLFRDAYIRFIKGLTGVIALKLRRASKNRKVVLTHKDRFWDLRPFTRVLSSWREIANLKHYLRVNELEGLGFSRNESEVRALADGGDSRREP